MKRQILPFLLIVILIASCNKKHDYKYVETILDKGVFGGVDKKDKDPVIIKAASDSDAYIEAYQKYCISVKVDKDMQASLGETYTTTVGFKLLNDKGEDVTYTIFATKSKQEKEIEDRIFSMNNSIKDAVQENKNQEAAKIKVDTVKVKELEKYFRVKSDEFSNENKKWYEPKNAPQYTNRNGIYCYFMTENGIPSNLRFRVQYYADEWLFFKKIQFSIDGKAFDYTPDRTETDSGNGGYIWEWFDQSLTATDKELVYALANAKSAKMKFIGRQYYNVKTISQDQISSIKRTIELYNAMGGQY